MRAYASVIHSVDRPALVEALAIRRGARRLLRPGEPHRRPGRGGVAPDGLDDLVEHVLGTPGLRLRGLMAVAPLGEPPRPAFARLRLLSERVRRIAPDAASLSMGMSHDFREAILEGATHLRIGTAITGNRPDAG